MPRGGGRGAIGRGRGRGGISGRGRGRGGHSADGTTTTAPSNNSPFSNIEGFDAPSSSSSTVTPTIATAPVVFEPMTPQELKTLKLSLLNTVSASLIKDPSFDKPTATAVRISRLIKKICWYDPEFPFKVALYSRTQLNIRSTSNYVLSVAANIKSCSPFFKKYFNASIKLPSDWLDVAATCQTLPDRILAGSAIPTCLRKAMVGKFADFDQYQLAKYNKEGAIKRKKKKLRLQQQKEGPQTMMDTPKQPAAGGKPTLTMKQMIRQLHMSSPAYAVMCILGKKYPENETEFSKAKLPGEFDAALAGKRMKLPVPETWETVLSVKGNKAGTWEELIEHKKLPFMAMLRNLRNLIFTGVTPKYHKWVQNKLTNAQTIASSKQFPFRFFSAYEVIPKDLDDFNTKLELLNNPGLSKQPTTTTTTTAAAAAPNNKRMKKRKNPIVPKVKPTAELFGQYRAALDTAVKLATTHNVKPIRGRTVVFVDVSRAMQDNTATSSVGKFNRLDQIGALLGLMCKYVCEDADFRVFNGSSSHRSVQLKEGTILDNMAVVEEAGKQLPQTAEQEQESAVVFPYDYVEELILKRQRIDNFLILSHHLVVPQQITADNNKLLPAANVGKVMHKYRTEVNPQMLFVSVDLSGKGCNVAQGDNEGGHGNDILVSGFSDAILRFIAERGDTNQLQHVEHIDIANSLQQLDTEISMKSNPFYGSNEGEADSDGDEGTMEVEAEEEEPPKEVIRAPLRMWRTARVFISSTFLDMHGERDMLTRKVFPALRDRCSEHRIHVDEVDLRWGITEKETQDAKGVQVCLDEVSLCSPFFLGFVGSRYGWCPDNYSVEGEKHDWIKAYPQGRSVTELEMFAGAIKEKNPHAWLYFRDAAFLNSVPGEHQRSFAPESDYAEERLMELKQNIRAATPQQVITYPASWGGVVDGKPVATGLVALQQRILSDLWSSICNVFSLTTDVSMDSGEEKDEKEEEESIEEENFFHECAVEELCRSFVGRSEVLKRLTEWADAAGTGIMTLVGSVGSGKSACVANWATAYTKVHSPKTKTATKLTMITHLVGASPASLTLRGMLIRLCHQLSSKKVDLPEDTKGLERKFAELLEEASFRSRVVIVLDGIDQLPLSERAYTLSWLPKNAPVKLLITANESGELLRALHQIGAAKQQQQVKEIVLGALEIRERRELIVKLLARYHKTLDERPMNDQMRMLLKKQDTSKPLYCAVACEELRVFGVYEKLSDMIKLMGPTTGKLFEEVLDRLEGDHTHDLVANALSAIVCSRGGLHERELLRILRRNKEEEQLPVALWSPLALALTCFVRRVQGLPISFQNSLMATTVERRYLTAPSQRIKQVHAQLAAFFLEEADPLHDGTFKGSKRGMSEVAYHLYKAAMWPQLVHVLTSLAFVERKCEFGMTPDLIADYLSITSAEATATTTTQPTSRFSSGASSSPTTTNTAFAGMNQVKQFAGFVAANSHILANRPHLTFQQAANQPDASSPAIQASKTLLTHTFIKWANKPQSSDLCHLTIDSSAACCLAYSPDGTLLAAGSRDCSVRVYEAKTGRELAVLNGHSAAVADLCFSPDGRFLATCSWDSTARLWDGKSFNHLATFQGHEERVSACCFTPDSSRLITAAWDLTLRVWSTSNPTDEPIILRGGHTRPINSISASLDNKHVASASWSGEIMLWDLDERCVVNHFKAHNCSVKSCVLNDHAEGELHQIVSTGTDGIVRLFDAKAAKFISDLGHHTQPTNSVSLSPNSLCVVTTSDDSSVRVWDASLAKQTSSKKLGPTILTMALSEDKQTLLTATADCDVILWSVDESNGWELSQAGKISGHTQLVNTAEFVGSNLIVTGSSDATIKVWDRTTLQQITGLTAHTATVNSIGVSPDERRMVSGSDDFNIIVWDVGTWKVLSTLRGHTGPVRSVSYSPNGKYIISAARDGTIRLWHAENGKELQTFKGHKDWINNVTWSPDSKHLVSSSWDFNCKLWNLRKAAEEFTLSGHQGSVELAKFSPDGLVVVSASFDGTLKVWDVKEGSLLTTLRGHEQRVTTVCFLDNRTVISASDDGSVKTWELLGSCETARLLGHSAAVRKAVFAPDNSLIATASDDSTIKLWNWKQAAAEAGQQQQTHLGPITSVAFSQSGVDLATASADGVVKLWHFNDNCTVSSVKSFTPSLQQEPEEDEEEEEEEDEEEEKEEKSPEIKELVAVRSVAFSADGDSLVITGDNGVVQLWDVPSLSLESVVHKHTKPARCVSVSPNGQFIASSSWACDVSVVSYSSSSTVVLEDVAQAHLDWPESLSFSPDSTLLASCGRDSRVNLFNLNTRSQSGQCCLDDGSWVTCLSWSPRGRLALVTGSWSGVLTLWDVASDGTSLTKKLDMKSEGSSATAAPITAVAFAPNGRFVIACSQDNCVKVWDVQAPAKPRLEFMTLAPPTSVALSAQTQLIIVGDVLGTVYHLQFRTPQLAHK